MSKHVDKVVQCSQVEDIPANNHPIIADISPINTAKHPAKPMIPVIGADNHGVIDSLQLTNQTSNTIHNVGDK